MDKISADQWNELWHQAHQNTTDQEHDQAADVIMRFLADNKLFTSEETDDDYISNIQAAMEIGYLLSLEVNRELT